MLMRYSSYACKDEDQIDGKKRTTSMYFISFCCPRNLQQTQLNQLAFNIYTDFSIKDINKKPIRVEAFISVWDKIHERVSINISRRSANQNRRVEKSNFEWTSNSHWLISRRVWICSKCLSGKCKWKFMCNLFFSFKADFFIIYWRYQLSYSLDN